VEVQNVRLRVLVFLVFDKVLNGGHMGECLHTEFTVEPTTQGVEDLVFLLCTVPD
jgi:hypothetical protein